MNNRDPFWEYYYSPERQQLSDEQARLIIDRVIKENPNLDFGQRLIKIRTEMKNLIFNIITWCNVK